MENELHVHFLFLPLSERSFNGARNAIAHEKSTFRQEETMSAWWKVVLVMVPEEKRRVIYFKCIYSEKTLPSAWKSQ